MSKNTMVLILGKMAVIAAVIVSFGAGSVAFAAPGNAENGAKLYMKKCWWCHGKEGEADGPGSEFMMPPPRDFSEGVYKYKTSAHDSDLARDEDLFTMISNGMPGTSMPSWKGILNDQERWDLVAHIKALTDMFEDEENPPAMSYGGKIASTPESIEKGKKAYEAAKCFECHGAEGKGDTMKKLKEESGFRVWPRNFTKAWTFRAGHTPEAIYSRVTNGIPNTPMPSFFSDKTDKGKLSEEDRWHVTNYVMSLADPARNVKDGAIVVKGAPVEVLPKDENDPAWDGVAATTFRLVPQIIQKERFFIPANDLIAVKTVFTGEEIAFLLEVDDRTNSLPGNQIAADLAWGGLNPDAIAIQTPVEIPEGSEKPYFGHGDGSHAVSMLYWNSGKEGAPNLAKLLSATGTGTREEADAGAAGFTATGTYKAGTWKVMMKRSLTTANTEKETQFEVGKYIPIAFANWDGSNSEIGSKHTMTTWRWLLLKPVTGSEVVTYPAAVFLLLVGVQFIFVVVGRKSNV